MSNKPKIMYVVKRLSGGIFTYLVHLTERLIDKYDIVIAYSTTPETPKGFRDYFDSRIPMFRIKNFSESSNILSFSGARAELKALVEEQDPDIIHFHGHGAGKIGRRALEGCGIPMFYTPHGYLYLAENHNILTRSMERRSEEQGAKIDCMTIACSKGEYAETLGLTDNATYVNNGIDMAELDEIVRNVKIEDHPLTVYTTGLINTQKNAGLFNEIAHAMPDVHFKWIGDGDRKYKLTAPNVHVTGWLSREDAIREAYSSDVFILTSLWEGLPISLLEAMYMRKLCVVSNVVGSRDVITNGFNGFVVDSAAAFVNAINQISYPHVEEIKENAYLDIVENYDVNKMAIAYDRIYQKALK